MTIVDRHLVFRGSIELAIPLLDISQIGKDSLWKLVRFGRDCPELGTGPATLLFLWLRYQVPSQPRVGETDHREVVFGSGCGNLVQSNQQIEAIKSAIERERTIAWNEHGAPQQPPSSQLPVPAHIALVEKAPAPRDGAAMLCKLFR